MRGQGRKREFLIASPEIPLTIFSKMKFVLLFLSCIPCFPISGAAGSQTGEKKPNIVFLLTEVFTF